MNEVLVVPMIVLGVRVSVVVPPPPGPGVEVPGFVVLGVGVVGGLVIGCPGSEVVATRHCE